MNVFAHVSTASLVTRLGQRVSYLLCCLILPLAIGCGGVEPPDFARELVQVGGRITLKGKPLVGVTVQLLPVVAQEGAAAATGYTDENGEFRLVTIVPGMDIRNTIGAVPGTYRVLLTKLTMPDGSPIPPDMEEAAAIEAGAVSVFPAVYSDPANSPLTAEVTTTGSKNLEFDL